MTTPFDPAARSSLGFDFERYDGVTSLDQVRQGFDLNLPRIRAYNHFKRWYENNFATLYNQRNSLVNGLSLFDFPDLVRLPIFQVPSKFYQDSILARRPVLTTEYEDLAEWYKFRRMALFAGLDDAIYYWSQTGAGIVVALADGTVQGTDPSEHIPVQDPENKNRIIGHVLAYRWRQRDPADLQTDKQQVANRVTVVWFDSETGTARSRVFHLGGSLIGEPVEEEKPNNTVGVFMFGNRTGWYESVQDAAAMMMVRVTLLNRLMNRFSDPHLWLPSGVGSANITMPGVTSVQQYAQLTAMQRRQLMEGKSALIEASIEGAGTGYGYIQGNSQAQESIAVLQWSGNWIHLSSGVSPTSWGINVGENESGEARKQAALRSSQLISETRVEIERFFPILMALIGAPMPPEVPPDEVMQWAWHDDPFSDREDSMEVLNKLYDVGAIDLDELREAAGYPPFTDTQREANDVARQQRDASDERMTALMMSGGRTNGNG